MRLNPGGAYTERDSSNNWGHEKRVVGGREKKISNKAGFVVPMKRGTTEGKQQVPTGRNSFLRSNKHKKKKVQQKKNQNQKNH